MKKLASPATAGAVGPVGGASPAIPASPRANAERPQTKGIQVSEHAYPSVDLEPYLSARDRKGGKRVLRDRSGGIALVREDALNQDLFRTNGVPLHNVGRRFRVVGEDGITEQERWIAPFDVIHRSRENPKHFDGLKLPLGELVFDHGLYLKFSPGVAELGVNDRGDVLLRRDSSSDPTIGPVWNSFNTVITGLHSYAGVS